MWKKRIDISGSRYGRLVVLKYDHTDKEGRACWQCLCDCGNVVVVSGKSLRTGNTKSCGCYNIEKSTERIVKRNTIHGDSHTRLFRIWALMHTRCYNPHAINYADYGGRGIKVCKEWDKEKEYDRLGLKEEYTEILGNKVVCHSLPIRPGRNLAVIVESAAVNHRQKKMGYNAAQELYNRVQANLAKKKED